MKVVLRADASPEIGTGHVMRCLALAQALGDTGNESFLVTTALPPTLRSRIEAESVTVFPVGSRTLDLDAAATATIANDVGADRLVVDGYRFVEGYLERFAGQVHRTLVADGSVEGFDAELIVNQNLFARQIVPILPSPDSELLLGPRFALLRREFGALVPRTVGSTVRRVLITLGGSDPRDVTRRILTVLEGRGLDIRVILGPLYRGGGGSSARRGASTMLSDVRDVPEQLMWADIVIGAAGTSALEYARAGVPAILVSIADNQTAVAAAFQRAGTAVDAGRPDSFLERRIVRHLERLSEDAASRQEMAQRGRLLVDGQGATRVARAMASPLRLRVATEEDARILFAWANEPAVRTASFDSRPILWEEHVGWLRDRLGDPASRIYIGLAGAHPVGVARFAVSAERAVISISVDPRWRGQGMGERLIAMAGQRLRREMPAISIDAWIRRDNEASLAAFHAAGYRVSEEDPDGSRIRLTLSTDRAR